MQDPVARPLKKAAGLESADIKAASMDRGKEDAAAMAPRMPEVVPQAALPSPFQSMKEYIRRHYRRQILAELENRVAKGMLQKPDAGGREPAFLRLGACTLEDMAFWRCDPYTVLADLRVKAELNAKKQIVTRDLYCELLIDMRKNGAFEFGEAGLLEERPARSGWMLSGYLVPILSREDVERGAEELLLRYCPRAWTNRREHPISSRTEWGCAWSGCLFTGREARAACCFLMTAPCLPPKRIGMAAFAGSPAWSA